MFLWKGFHTKCLFWARSKYIHKEEIDGFWGEKREAQIRMIMETIVIDSHNCWLWAGAKTSGVPSVLYNGAPLHAMKVFLAWMTNDVPVGISSHRRCNSRFCINPAHHCIGGLNINLPIDPKFMPGMERREQYWWTDEVLPWEDLRRGIRTLEKPQEIEPPQAMAPTAADDYRTFFKISKSSGGEAAIHAENGIEENS